MESIKKIKMELLNNEESDQIRGGESTTCTKSGDTIACNLLTKIVACAYEVICKPSFSSSCENKTFEISGCNTVVFS